MPAKCNTTSSCAVSLKGRRGRLSTEHGIPTSILLCDTNTFNIRTCTQKLRFPEHVRSTGSAQRRTRNSGHATRKSVEASSGNDHLLFRTCRLMPEKLPSSRLPLHPTRNKNAHVKQNSLHVLHHIPQEHARSKAGQLSEVNLDPDSLADMVSIVVKQHACKTSLHEQYFTI